MPELPLEDAIPRFKTNEARIDRFANGAENETWETDNGTPVPSIQKFLRDQRAVINEGGGSILAEARSARDGSVAGANRSEAAADAAQENAATATAQAGRALSEADRARSEADRAASQSPDNAVTHFTSRAALGAAVPSLRTGSTVLVNGFAYTIDPTATGYDSALSDLGINGVRRGDRLENLFIAAHFTTQDDSVVNISVSLDGINFSLLNSAVLPGGAIWNLSQRDPAIVYFNGWWWIFGTGNAAGSHDFVVFRSRDLSTWSKHQIAMAGGPYTSATAPMPGGSAPASAIWAPEPYVENGRLYVMISIRYGADFTGVYGTTQMHFRPYYCECINPDTLAFSAPIAMDFQPGYPANVRQWRADTGAVAAPTLPLVHQGGMGAGRAGFETSLMEHLSRFYPNDTILLVPAGKGSSGFANGEWVSGGPARTEFTARLNAALAANPGAVIEGMFWHQGEADRNNPSYQTQVLGMMDYARNTWSNLATRPIIMGEIGTFVSGAEPVNTIINAVVNTRANIGLASSAGLTDNGDALHFDANSYRTLGDRYFTAWRALRGNVPASNGGVVRIFVIAGQSNAAGLSPAYTSYAAGVSLIDASVVKHNGRYYCAIKDDAFKRIRVYSATSLAGPWAFSQSLGDTTRSIEAPCLTRVRDRNALGSETPRDKWRIYVDNNRTGPTDSAPDMLVGAPLYFEALGAPDGNYGDLLPMYFDTPVRHGSVYNLAEAPPEAAASLAVVAAAGGTVRENLAREVSLSAGEQWIMPQQDVTYVVEGSATAVNLLIRNGPADRFYLAVYAASPNTGLNVLSGGRVPRGFLVGFGRCNNCILEMRRRGDGSYYPVGMVRRAEFKVHRNGVAQSITAAADTLVQWTTVPQNLGGAFDLVSRRWTPPQGKVDLTLKATVTNNEGNGTLRIEILKNGAVIDSHYAIGGGLITAQTVLLGDDANGTDYYEARVRASGSGSREINGNANLTSFSGICW